MAYTSYLVKQRLGLGRFDAETRAQLGFRFRTMYRNLGWDRATCAKNLHVTLRTLHNWESGRHDIPYSAYRLLRLLGRMELPGESWTGWCFVGGVLYTPEGRPITGKDGSWWSLLVRQAHGFRELMARGAEGRAVGGAPPCGEATAARPAAPGPDAPASVRREAPAPWVPVPTQQIFKPSPMVITGITNGVPPYGIRQEAAHGARSI